MKDEVHTELTIGQVLGYVNQLLVDWHIMVFIQAGLLLLVVIGAIVFIRRLWLGS
ncbi:MAG: hypothetical protein H7836_15630 [Magnetococcus sp. YQC-3]